MSDYTLTPGQPMGQQIARCTRCGYTSDPAPHPVAVAAVTDHVTRMHHAPAAETISGFRWTCACGTTYYAPGNVPGERLLSLQATHLEMHAMTEEKR